MSDLFAPGWGALAAAVGVPYGQVTSAEGFDAALAAAHAVRVAPVVEVDAAAVGPKPVPFASPVAIPGH